MTRRHPILTGNDRQNAIADAARCKATRSHRMDPIPAPPNAPRPHYGSLIVYRCELCGTLRYDTVNRNTGELYHRSYDHPTWYLAADDDRNAPGWWRARWWDDLDAGLFLEPDTVVPIHRKRA